MYRLDDGDPDLFSDIPSTEPVATYKSLKMASEGSTASSFQSPKKRGHAGVQTEFSVPDSLEYLMENDFSTTKGIFQMPQFKQTSFSFLLGTERNLSENLGSNLRILRKAYMSGNSQALESLANKRAFQTGLEFRD